MLTGFFRIHNIAFSPDEKYLAMKSLLGQIYLYSLDTFEKVAETKSNNRSNNYMFLFSKDGGHLINISADSNNSHLTFYRIPDLSVTNMLYSEEWEKNPEAIEAHDGELYVLLSDEIDYENYYYVSLVKNGRERRIYSITDEYYKAHLKYLNDKAQGLPDDITVLLGPPKEGEERRNPSLKALFDYYDQFSPLNRPPRSDDEKMNLRAQITEIYLANDKLCTAIKGTDNKTLWDLLVEEAEEIINIYSDYYNEVLIDTEKIDNAELLLATMVAEVAFSSKKLVKALIHKQIADKAKNVLANIKHMVIQLKNSASDAFDEEDYATAYTLSTRAFDILKTLEHALGEQSYAKLMLDIAHIAIAAPHNARLSEKRADYSFLRDVGDRDYVKYAVEIFTIILDLSVRSTWQKPIKQYLAKYKEYSYYAYRIAWIKIAYKYVTSDFKNGLLFAYLDMVKYYTPGSQTDWLTMYEGRYFADFCPDETEGLAKWFCDNIDTLEAKKMIYFSTLFENIALEYAFKNDLPEVAYSIVEDAYDHYLEMPTLYLMHKYNREVFDWYVNDIKYLCFERLLDQFYHYRDVSRTSDFAREMIEIANDRLAKRNKDDKSDHRNIKERQIYKYKRDEDE